MRGGGGRQGEVGAPAAPLKSRQSSKRDRGRMLMGPHHQSPSLRGGCRRALVAAPHTDTAAGAQVASHARSHAHHEVDSEFTECSFHYKYSYY